ncbi:hypothetical protein ACFVWT_18845 [Arthrobacter sp. NPDC058288]|uniref:hypothetical protein n=1 Tax=Arthrobacter sp. NPDC058288 TaxID=3346424 RepID=UPI0036EE50E5
MMVRHHQAGADMARATVRLAETSKVRDFAARIVEPRPRRSPPSRNCAADSDPFRRKRETTMPAARKSAAERTAILKTIQAKQRAADRRRAWLIYGTGGLGRFDHQWRDVRACR